MKILQFSSARSFGGGERHLVELANALAARGHDVYVALAPDSPLTPRLTRLPRDNIFTVSGRSAFNPRAAWKLARLIRDRKIEIVHAHLARDYPVTTLAVRRQPRVHLFFTRHVLFPLGPIHRLTFARAARVIAVSESVLRRLRAQRLAPSEKIICISNGIDFSQLDAKPGEPRAQLSDFLSAAPEGEVIIGTSGELSAVKDQETFIRAAARVVTKYPRTRFLIAGQENAPGANYTRHLRQLVNELGLGDRVSFLGWLEEIPPFLQALTIFVSSSRTESFGLAMAEAMACGVPVVATETEGARELIGNGEGGLLVPIGEAAALAEAILALLQEPVRRAELARSARERVRGRFSLERMVKETEQLYEECLTAEN